MSCTSKYQSPKNKTKALVLLKKHNKWDTFCDFQTFLAYYISVQCIEYAYQHVATTISAAHTLN